MPKPVKKKQAAARKRVAKRPVGDPAPSVDQLMREHFERAAGEDISPPQGDPFRDKLTSTRVK